MKKTTIARLFSLAICLVVSSAFASDLNKIQKMVARTDTLCGQFVQQKRLSGVTRTITSSGRFCVDQKKGILWRNIKPFASSMHLTRHEIIQYRNGSVANRMSASKEPMVKVINELMFSLIAGNFSQLDQYFNISSHVAGNKWHAFLSSRNASVAKVIQHIHISGDNYIRHVNLREQSGDVTSITFSDMQTGRSAVRPEEAQIF